MNPLNFNHMFRCDALANFIGIFVAFFSILVVIYSFGFMKGRKGLYGYYLCILLTALASLGVVYSNHLIVLMIFWGFVGFLLYLLVGWGETQQTSQTAKKTLIIIGATDAFMLLGLALIWRLTGTFEIDKLSIPLDNRLATWAYLCLALGAFAKAGVMPVHTWIPDVAENAPTPVSAFLPAALDKLLGIYFLTRISLDVFGMNQAMNTMLLILGSVTILAAVMMALVQHDLKRLLGYHAVSQVGYMILGIGTGNPIGIAGGLFHMLNNAVYKSCLFFCGGAVEKHAGTTDLDKLGGFAKIMPVTFAAFLISSLAISGVPPLNGFASKWMIYQGLIETGKTGNPFWVLWLMTAMLGSALTLASFMKLLHAVFLGLPSRQRWDLVESRKDPGIAMLFPIVILAALSLVFGIFAYRVVLTRFIFPSLKQTVVMPGLWDAGLAATLIFVGLAVGLGIFLLGRTAKIRPVESFIGGEPLSRDMRISGTEFYNTIEDIGILKRIYGLAKQKAFDIYDLGKNITSLIFGVLHRLHNGVLPTYLTWCLFGAIVLFYFLFR